MRTMLSELWAARFEALKLAVIVGLFVAVWVATPGSGGW